MEIQPYDNPTYDNPNNGGAFLVGAGIGSLVTGLIVNSKCEQKYQQGRLDERWEIQKTVFAKNLEIARLNNLLTERNIQLEKKDLQIAQLTDTVGSLSATIKAQQLEKSAKIFPRDDSDIGLN